MTAPRTPSAGGRYELKVAAHLDDHWSTWFGGLTLHRESDGTTTLRGGVSDQAELHGLLAKIRDLGVALVSVNALDGEPDTAPDGDVPIQHP